MQPTKKLFSPFQEALTALRTGERLVCWQGSICDNTHPWIRADRLRLWSIVRLSTMDWECLSLAGVRPAAVLATETPGSEAYRLMFIANRDVFVITYPDRRKGRHAWAEHLQTGEHSELLTRSILVRNSDNPCISAPLFRAMQDAYNLYIQHETLDTPTTLEVPSLVLVAHRGTKVFHRNQGMTPKPMNRQDKTVYWASEVYGQGVLAAEPSYPMGYWQWLPADAELVCDLPELYVNLGNADD